MKQLYIGFLFIMSFTAHAYTGDELLIDCQWYVEISNDDGTTGSIGKSLSAGRCQGFISGLIQSYNHYVKNNQIQTNVFCLSGNENTKQLAETLVSYLKRNEASIGQAAASLSIQALHESYSCN